MLTLGYIVYGVGILLAIVWMLGLRTYTRDGRGIQMTTVNITMLFIISLVLISVLHISPLNLLWMYPVSIALGMLSLVFPFSLLSLPGHVIYFIACIGLSKNEIDRNKERIRRGVELVQRDGLTVADAKKQLEKEGF